MKVEDHKPEQEVCMKYTQLEQSFLDSLICSAAELATAIRDPSASFIQSMCVCVCVCVESFPRGCVPLRGGSRNTHTPIASVAGNKQEIEISSTLPQALLLTPSLAFTGPRARPEHQPLILYAAWVRHSDPDSENTAQLFCECRKCSYSACESALNL